MNPRVLAVRFGLFVIVALTAAGCRTGHGSADATVADSAEQGKAALSPDEESRRAGALAWSENCMRCHNLRNPMERSDREWDVIVQHMRVRGNLTAEESRLILQFLQSAN